MNKLFRNSICAWMCMLQLHNVHNVIIEIMMLQLNKSQNYKLLSNKKYNLKKKKSEIQSVQYVYVTAAQCAQHNKWYKESSKE